VKPGRPRKFDPTIPAHIDQRKLPAGAYWEPRCRIWYARVGSTKPTIAPASATLAQLHVALEQIRSAAGPEAHGTLGWLLSKFHASQQFAELAESTRTDYGYCAKAARAYKTRWGQLSDLPLASITTPALQVVVDKLAADGTPSKANHLLRYLRRVFTWGVQRGHCTANPGRGVKQAREVKAFKMPEADVLTAVTRLARERGALPAHSAGAVPAYLWAIVVLAYRCRLRSIETITLTEAQLDDVGIVTSRRKGSRDNHVKWSPELRDAVDAALAYRATVWARHKTPVPIQKENRPLFVSQTGGPLAPSTLKTAWRRLLAIAVEVGTIAEADRFTLHGLKHRGVTDTKGGLDAKQRGAGHKSQAMTHRYDHELPVVEPAGE
jgi:integrase